MSAGWKCPQCGYCYAPWRGSCDNCNRPHHEKYPLSSTSTSLEYPMDFVCSKCQNIKALCTCISYVNLIRGFPNE